VIAAFNVFYWLPIRVKVPATILILTRYRTGRLRSADRPSAAARLGIRCSYSPPDRPG